MRRGCEHNEHLGRILKPENPSLERDRANGGVMNALRRFRDDRYLVLIPTLSELRAAL